MKNEVWFCCLFHWNILQFPFFSLRACFSHIFLSCLFPYLQPFVHSNATGMWNFPFVLLCGLPVRLVRRRKNISCSQEHLTWNSWIFGAMYCAQLTCLAISKWCQHFRSPCGCSQRLLNTTLVLFDKKKLCALVLHVSLWQWTILLCTKFPILLCSLKNSVLLLNEIGQSHIRFLWWSEFWGRNLAKLKRLKDWS